METIKNILRLEIFKFALAGALCACLEFITFNVLIDVFNIRYLISNVISVVLAISVNYLLSRAFVFKKSKYSRKKELLSFVFFSVLALLLNQFILWMLVEIIKFDVRICKAIAIGLVAFFNYITKKHVVFRA